jgi:hypothetical protein
VCNDSPVDYHKVGVVVVLTRYSCAITPIGLPEGTGERFDPATGRWVTMEHPVITTGMDYLGAFDDVQDLPKGKAVTLRYRVSLDASMIDGKGGVEATAVVPDPLVQIGRADLPFTSRRVVRHRRMRPRRGRPCCRSRASPTRAAWRWTRPAPSISPTPGMTGC